MVWLTEGRRFKEKKHEQHPSIDEEVATRSGAASCIIELPTVVKDEHATGQVGLPGAMHKEDRSTTEQKPNRDSTRLDLTRARYDTIVHVLLDAVH